MCNLKEQTSLEKRDFTQKYGPMLTALSTLPLFAVSTFAAADLGTAIKSILNSVGTLLTSVFGPLCILVLGLAIVSILVGKNSKSAESGMEWAKRACICFVIFNLLGSILTWGLALFSNTNVGAWGTTTEALISVL